VNPPDTISVTISVPDLSAKEAARELAISETSVKRLFRAGVLRSYRAGKLWRTTYAWLDAFRNYGGGGAA
jgi:excisionase family DNA binding protein